MLGGVCHLKFCPVGSESAPALEAEGRLLAELRHPHLVQLTSRFQGVLEPAFPGPVLGHSTAWVDGEPFVAACADLPLAERLARFAGLLQVVGYLHHRDLLHLDLKSQNVLVSAESGVVLLDLGSARSAVGPPGEAGGTLGFAAPEVLAGQAASVASDIYSLGAILYELLTGLRPHGDLEPQELRRACLGGDIIPVRVVRREVPQKLAQLAQEMLALQAGVRPRSVGEVLGRLRDLGFPVPHADLGAPPFVGRELELQALHTMLRDRRNVPIAVLGPRGRGRSRLVRHALLHDRVNLEQPKYDLSSSDRPFLALQRLLSFGSPRLPPAGTVEFLPALRESLVEHAHRAGAVFLGRLEEMAVEDRDELVPLLPILARSGFTIVLACERVPQGCIVFPLGPLPDPALEAIGQFVDVHQGPALRQAIERSAGNPANLLRQLAGGAHPGTLAPELRLVLDALATLPSGLSAPVIEALPPSVRERIATLSLYGFLWRDAEGLLQLDGAQGGTEVHELLRPAVERLVREPGASLDPLWRALAAARLGLTAIAEAGLVAAEAAAHNRQSELEELLSRVAASGSRVAALMLARQRMANADMSGALAALAAIETPDAACLELQVRAMRLSGRNAEAEALARAALQEHPAAGLWLELATCLSRRDALEEASEAVGRAVAMAPELLEGEGMSVQLVIASRAFALGQESPSLLPLLSRVEALGANATLSASTLALAGRTLMSMGLLERGERLLARASAAADREGDLRLSAVTRLNRGAALERMDRARDARQAFSEALLIVRATGQQELLMRLTYSLAFLEIRVERLPAAEAFAAEFNQVVARIGDARALERGRILEARLEQLRGRSHRVIALLDGMDVGAMPRELATERAIVLARAHLAVAQAAEALRVLDGAPAPVVPSETREVHLLRGRALLALGRDELALAKSSVGESFDPSERVEVGEVLLAHAGEDLDPASFAWRRRDLDLAARLLRGEPGSRAATLRDRLLEGPGAALEGIVELIEAMNTPQAVPTAIARLVTEALGANRVLILVRMPGLGQQVTYKELAGEEAAGIGREVLSRITGPDDVWMSRDAFADPVLREASATVRTFEIKSLLAVAIPHENKAIGALYVDDLRRPDRFTELDVRVLQRLAAAAGRMIALLPTANQRHRSLPEPRDVLGVLLSDPDQLAALNDATSYLRGRRETNLLVSGPTGVGKTWFARRVATEVLGLAGLEELAVRQGDSQFLVSQLSGTKRGEFSGALDKQGAIQRAITEHKALFIDEIQALSDPGQQALLPLLEQPLRRFGGLMGSTQPIHGPLHIILGTNVEVAGKRWAEHFRADLWYRMSDVHVALPSLAERGPEVVYLYLARMLEAAGDGLPEEVFEVAALQRVTNWDWTGNLRQLQSFASQAAYMHMNLRNGRPVPLSELHRLGLVDEGLDSAGYVSEASMLAQERELVISALRRANWIQAEAARILGINRWKMLRLVRKHALEELIRERRDST